MKLFRMTLCAFLVGYGAFAANGPDNRILIESYFRYLLSQQIASQAGGLAADSTAEIQTEVEQAVSQWTGDLMDRVRSSLEQQWKEEAREKFSSFVATYTTAEKDGDISYLRSLAKDTSLSSTMPKNYAEFHGMITAGWMKTDVESGAALLGEIQTWIDVQARNADTPPLSAWLGRHSKMVPVRQPAAPAQRPKPSRRNALRNAEAPPPEFQGDTSETPAAMDTFAQARQERRQRALEEAQAGMEQVAAERDAAEREYAAKKTAAAQAEAEAVKRQADKLAAAETEALEQRKDSWGNKLKGVLSATVGAAAGAFSGGIGTEAGTRLADAIFNAD